VVERVPLEIPHTDYNLRYLLTKKQRMGHLLGLGESSGKTKSGKDGQEEK